MKQNIYIAALLAGMLALAGCGGGSSSGPANGMGTGMNGNGDAEPKTLTETGLANDTGKVRTIRIDAGKKHTTPSGMISCTSDTACRVTVSADEGSPVVTVTEGAATFAKTTPAGNTTPTGDSVAQSSDENIINAIAGDAKIHGQALKLDDNLGSAGQKIAIGDNKEVVLRLGTATKVDSNNSENMVTLNAATPTSSNYIFWGYWQEGTIGSDKSTRTLLWGGDNPYEKKPDSADLDKAKAKYLGDALLYHKTGTATTWTAGSGTVDLDANFADGTIKGTVLSTPANGFGTGVSISLGEASISDTGTFSGSKTKFTGGKNFDAGSGSWSGQFFGDELGQTQGGDNPNFGKDIAPSNAAGQFSVTRNAKAEIKARFNGEDLVPATPALTVQGSFGTVLDQ